MKDCVTKWWDKHALTTIIMAPYMHSLEFLLDAHISELQHLQPLQHSSIFNESSFKDSLNHLQDKFVIVPIDKATFNVAFICKRFFAKVILRELGLNTDVNNATYSAVNDSCHIIKQHTNLLLQKFGLTSTENNGRLPNIYWLAKLHKSPIKLRFIIVAPECSMKPLVHELTSVFKLFQRQICKYNKISSFFSGIKTFWVIDNNIPVLEVAHKLSRSCKAQSLEMFDFSTLYTKIPHYKLTNGVRNG